VRRFRFRWTAIATVVALVTVASASAAVAQSSGGGSSGGPPKATEIGVSPTTIRIAVIADVNTPLAPGIFKSSADAVQAFGAYVNKHGGIAGRKLQVDFIDSKLDADESRNALIQACQNDFATVGTTALFMNNVDDAVNCKDVNGAPTGLPDIPELTTEPAQQNSPVSFPIIAPERDYKITNAEVYHARRGQIFWFQKHISKALNGIFLVPADLQATKTASEPGNHAIIASGVKDNGDFNVHGMDTQSAYLPIATSIKSTNSNYVRNGSNDVSEANMRIVAQQQGVSGVKIWDCSLACYSQNFLKLGGAAVEGQYLETFFVPLEEAKNVPVEQAYINGVGAANASGFGAQAWIAALFFQAVVNKIAATSGVNGVTRAAFLQQAATFHAFTASGMMGPTDIGGKFPSGCFDLLQVKGGKFTRVYPSKAATFDCNPNNLATVTFHAQ
jgi:ABC-type branched-subunit amino acid transport system substrate-binding protein